MGRKGYTWLTGYSLSLTEAKEEPKAGTLRQELKQRPWKNATFWPC